MVRVPISDYGSENFVLGFKVIINSTQSEFRFSGDLPHGGGMESLVQEKGIGRLKNCLAGTLTFI
jgi:hypothetical protein